MLVKFARLSAIGAIFAFGTAGYAQSLRDVAVPAEFPPSSYSGSQYVDSRGCVYIRAGLSGTVNWVPRVSRSRQPMCGFQPSGVSGATATPAQSRTEAPIIQIPQAGQPAAAPAARTAQVKAPQTARTTTSSATPSFTPIYRSPSVQPASQPRQISKTEACSGRYGVLSGVLSARTGQPVDCGPAPETTPAVTTQPVAPLQRVQVGGTAPCVDSVTNGTFAATGYGGCPPQTRSIVTGNTTPQLGRVGASRVTPSVAVPSAPAYTATPNATPVVPTVRGAAQASPWACLDAVRRGQTSIAGPDGQVLNCRPQTASPSGVGRGLPGSDQGAALSGDRIGVQVPRRSGTIAQAHLVRGSKPHVSGAQPPAGYRHVWTDGRLNTQRGITVLRF